jgi:ribosomal protein L31E
MEEQNNQPQEVILPMTEMIKVTKEKKYKELVKCDCGVEVTKSNVAKHKKSKNCKLNESLNTAVIPQATKEDLTDIVNLLLEEYNDVSNAIINNDEKAYTLKRQKLIVNRLAEIASYSSRP